MNERVMQFRVGVMVFITLIIGGLLVTLNSPIPKSWIPWADGSYDVNIDLKQAPGIGPNTPIRKNGLLIGRVKSIQDLDDRVVLQAEIDKGHNLYPGSVAQVRTSVLGDATIEFDSGNVIPGTPPLKPGATVQGRVSPNPLEGLGGLEEKVDKAANSLGRAGDEVAELAKNLNATFEDKNGVGRVQHLIDQAEVTLADISRAMQSMDGMTEAIQETRLTMKDSRVTLHEMQSAIESANRNLKNLEGLTQPLGESGESVAKAFLGSIDSLDRLIEEVTVLVQALNSSEGTMGQLIHSREVGDSLLQLMANANYVLVKINEIVTRLRPVVEDARVFMDKIAREPGRLIGGALNPGPGIK
jgi:phospholipid/cholesterol/gamma-HCH transport system substrate-binding protein